MRTSARLRRATILTSACCIGALTLFGCGAGNQTYSPAVVSGTAAAPTPTFRLAVTPASSTVVQGAVASYMVTLTAVNNFEAVVTPSVPGLPEGATATFTPQTVTPTAAGSSGTMTVSTTGVTASTYTLTVTANGGGVQKQQTVQLIVTAQAAQQGSLNGTIE